jgi:hypothetical protein
VNSEITTNSKSLLSGREFELISLLRDLFNQRYMCDSNIVLLEKFTRNGVIILDKQV